MGCRGYALDRLAAMISDEQVEGFTTGDLYSHLEEGSETSRRLWSGKSRRDVKEEEPLGDYWGECGRCRCKCWRSFPLCEIRIDCCVATQVWRCLLFRTAGLPASDVRWSATKCWMSCGTLTRSRKVISGEETQDVCSSLSRSRVRGF